MTVLLIAEKKCADIEIIYIVINPDIPISPIVLREIFFLKIKPYPNTTR
jgi:hypothetical protein